MKRTWFALPGTVGDRTLEEQMTGIESAIAEAKGRTVLDLGSAEGLIGMEFLAAGATFVYGCDCNRRLLDTAEEVRKSRGIATEHLLYEHRDLNRCVTDAKPIGPRARYDIVLALAVLHKLLDPSAAVHVVAEWTASLLVIRLPLGSTGFIRSKFRPEMGADIPAILPRCGFALERTVTGPRDELVQYWRRAA